MDLVGTTASRADQALGEDAPDDAWAILANTMDNLGSASVPPPSEISRPSVLPETLVPETLAADERSEDVHTIPIDLSLKTRLRIVSHASLHWARTRSQGEEYYALQNISSGALQIPEMLQPPSSAPLGSDAASPGPTPSERLTEAKRLFYRSLLHFRFPYAPLPSVISTRWQAVFSPHPANSRAEIALGDIKPAAIKRLSLWQSSLQSLYFGYKYSLIDHFYVILSTTTILFTRGMPDMPVSQPTESEDLHNFSSSSSDVTLRACFSKASPGLRALLSEYTVDFNLILSDSERDPCVVVEGTANIHALYNFICSVGPKLSNATDVPILVCDAPFRGGTPMSLDVSNSKEAFIASTSSSHTLSRFTLKISGYCTPRQMRGICEALTVTQQKDFTVYMDTDPSGDQLNACGHSRRSLKKHDSEKFEVLRGAQVLSRIGMSPSSESFSSVTRDIH